MASTAQPVSASTRAWCIQFTSRWLADATDLRHRAWWQTAGGLSKIFDLYDSISVNADVPGSEGDSIAARPASTK